MGHFSASVLIANRKDPKTIQALIGHEDIKTTLNVFGHLLKRVPAKAEPTSGMLAARLRLSRVFGQAPGRNKLKAGSRLLISPFPEIKFILSCCGVL